ncbi:uncharacterized protein KD926_009070 [Aspergillus affinis]|uniref:uncharacterized protein n=1 Tax=Aspergillus affinis TaxID=1070780 RepID=UPI0022FE437D|nr:uncharacterized protein KD926_009070 [Aspergillus affinis]KAI9039851.1 hypothetical protein KD926_009070 [Aspergillus affinis]
MDSPTTPKPKIGQAAQAGYREIWHPKTRSAGLGWMERPEVRYLYMYFDIRDFVLQSMSATAEEVTFLVLRRLVPERAGEVDRKLSYPSMKELNSPPPEGFQRISMRYLMTDIPQELETSREDIIPALRRIREHLKKLKKVPGPFRPFELMDPDLFRQTVWLKFDFLSPQRESSPNLEPDAADSLTNSYSDLSEVPNFELSDCSSFQGHDEELFRPKDRMKSFSAREAELLLQKPRSF